MNEMNLLQRGNQRHTFTAYIYIYILLLAIHIFFFWRNCYWFSHFHIYESLLSTRAFSMQSIFIILLLTLFFTASDDNSNDMFCITRSNSIVLVKIIKYFRFMWFSWRQFTSYANALLNTVEVKKRRSASSNDLNPEGILGEASKHIDTFIMNIQHGRLSFLWLLYFFFVLVLKYVCFCAFLP